MDERTILRKAKGVLLERGWHQGNFCADLLGETGAVCVAGAVKVAMFGDPYRNSETRPEGIRAAAVYQALRNLTGWQTIPAWNDEPGRTIDDVVGLIDRAIASLPPEAPAEAPELEKAVA